MSSKSWKEDALAPSENRLTLELRKENPASALRREWSQMVVRRLMQFAARYKPDAAASEAG